jgi:superfamily I DNA/RNA helicase
MAKDFMVKESELDDIQQRVLDQTLDRSCIVTGCAGSGKSVIALQKAKRIQNEKGGDYEIIVYTRALCDYMNGGRSQLQLNRSFYYQWKWGKDGNPPADYVIVDEIQDFTKEEIQQFMKAARKNFFFFGDTAQSIYGQYKDTMPVERIREMSAGSKEFSLYNNYRLPKPVAKITQDYIGVDVDSYGDGSVYRSKENQLPRFLKYNSLREQVIAISNIIKRNSLTDVGILVPQNDQIPEISRILDECKVNHEIKYKDKSDWRNNQDTLNFSSSNPKLFTSVH